MISQYDMGAVLNLAQEGLRMRIRKQQTQAERVRRATERLRLMEESNKQLMNILAQEGY